MVFMGISRSRLDEWVDFSGSENRVFVSGSGGLYR